MKLDRRHTIIEKTRALTFVKRTNDYAIYSNRSGLLLITVLFIDYRFPKAAEERAFLVWSFVQQHGWK